jgi:hypothetical protein
MKTSSRFRISPLFFLFLLLAAPAGTAFAQISISSVDRLKAMAVGNWWRTYQTPTGVKQSIHVGTASATAQEWDFRALPWQESSVTVSIDPLTAPEIATFPSAELVTKELTLPDWLESRQYSKLSNTEWTMLGFASRVTVTTLKPPLLVFKFPCAPGSTWSAQSDPQYPIPSVTMETAYSWQADAFGTLRLPSGDVPALRIRNVIANTVTTLSGSYVTRSIHYLFVSKGITEATVTIDTADDGKADVLGSATYDVETSPPLGIGGSAGNAPSFRLGASYPHPASSIANIPLELASPQHARIEITDMLGRRVALLHDGMLDAGSHTMRWNAAPVESGVYLCSVHIGGTTRTLRLLHQR